MQRGGCGSILNDLIMIRHRFDGDIVLYPIADVHYGAIEHNEAEWKRLLTEVQDQPNAFVVLNGDLINNTTRSSVSDVYEETVRPRTQKTYMVDALMPIRDRILCITSGNHERRSGKDADNDPTYDIACKLDIEHLYRYNIAFMALGIGDRGDNHPTETYRIAVTHGAGGGIYTGATVNRNERFGNIIDGLDCLIVGHTHKGTITRPSKLVVDVKNGVVVQRDYVVLSCVSWMNYGGYAMQKMLLPSAHSVPQKLLLKGSKTRHHDKKIEILW